MTNQQSGLGGIMAQDGHAMHLVAYWAVDAGAADEVQFRVEAKVWLVRHIWFAARSINGTRFR